MNIAFSLNNSKAIPLMMQLAYKNMKKPGAGLAEELTEVARRHPEWVTIIGKTEMDADLMTGNMRELNPKLKILNLNEERRKKEGENNV